MGTMKYYEYSLQSLYNGDTDNENRKRTEELMNNLASEFWEYHDLIQVNDNEAGSHGTSWLIFRREVR